MALRQRMSVDEYLALPEEKPYIEYIDGDAVPKTASDYRHMQFAGEVITELTLYRRIHGGVSGPEGRVELLGSDRVQFRLPDIGYWAPGREVDGPRAMIPPTLAVEVRSPDDTMAEQRAKCRFYRNNGVDVCWLVDPDTRTVEVFENGREGLVLGPSDTLTTPHLPGFELNLAALFAVLDR